MSLLSLLQARGAPLREPELWSILAETTAFIDVTDSAGLSRTRINPHTLVHWLGLDLPVLASNGTVHVQMAHHQAGPATNIFHSAEQLDMSMTTGRDDVQKSHLYSLGIVLFYAADFGMPDHLHPTLSEDFEAVVAGMVHEVPHERLSVHEVMAMCSGVQLGPESHRRRIAKLAGGAAAGVRQTQPQQPQQPQGQGGAGAGGVGAGAGQPSRPSSQIQIKLLDGRTTAMKVFGNTSVNEVFDRAAADSQLEGEDGFFGLSYISSDGDERFVASNRPLLDQLPANCHKINFRVEFYVENISVLSMELTRHLYYLQVKSDIVSGHTFVPGDQSILLAAYGAQAEFGDVNPNRSCAIPLQRFLPPSTLKTSNPFDLQAKIAERQGGFRGMTRYEAEKRFLTSVQNIEDYGVLYHPVSSTQKQHAPDKFIGAGARGIIIYEQGPKGRKVTRGKHPWRQIQSLSLPGGKRKIKIDLSKALAAAAPLVFFATSKTEALYIVDRIRSLGEFHRLIRDTYPDTAEARASLGGDAMLSMATGGRTRAGASPRTALSPGTNPLDLNRSLSPTISTASVLEAEVTTILASTWQFCENKLDTTGLREYGDPRLVRIDKQHGDLGLSIAGGFDTKVGGLFVISKKEERGGTLSSSLKKDRKDRLLEINGQSVVDATHDQAVAIIKQVKTFVVIAIAEKKRAKRMSAPSISTDSGNSSVLAKRMSVSSISTGSGNDAVLTSNLSPPPSQQQQQQQQQQQPDEQRQDVPQQGRDESSVERIPIDCAILNATVGPVEEVEVRKGQMGLGMKVVGGAGSILGGSFIRDFAPDGAAYEDGRLAIGDRILKVDGQDLDGATHQDTVDIMQQSGIVIRMLIQHTDPDQIDTLFAASDAADAVEDAAPAVSAISFARENEDRPGGPAFDRADGADGGLEEVELPDDVFEVVLVKPPGGSFGFGMSGGPESKRKRPLHVKKVLEGSLAEECGVAKGDMILEINGITVEGMSQSEATELTKETDELQLLLHRAPMPRGERDREHEHDQENQPPRPQSYLDAAAAGPSPELLTGQSSANNVGDDVNASLNDSVVMNDEQTEAYEDFSVSVETGVQGLGVKFGGVPVPGGGFAIVISHIWPEGAVARCGEVEVNDQILTLNGHSMAGITPDRLQALLERSAERGIVDLFLRRKGDTMPDGPAPPTPGSERRLGGIREDDGEAPANASVELESDDEFGASRPLSPGDGGVSHLRDADLYELMMPSIREAIVQGIPAREFGALGAMDYGHKNITSKLEQHKKRNRYKDIHPHEQTRVVLNSTGDADHDYINGNHVHLPVNSRKQRHIIMTQGPLEATVTDFWRMVWENDIPGVIMVTSEVEKGRKKCHRYWPTDVGVTASHAEFEVSIDRVESLGHSEVSTMTLCNTKSDETRTVFHFRFLEWPDHGVPESPGPFLDLVEEVDARCGAEKPLVAHCSAGIGRSGVFTIMSVVRQKLLDPTFLNDLRAKGEGTLSHEALSLKDLTTLARMARFRAVVQTQVQYEFCYQAFVELLERLVAGEDEYA